MDSLGQSRRILIIKPSSLGDIVHAFPMVEQILHHEPDARIDWVANSEFVPLVRRHPGIHRVLSFPRKEWGSPSFFSSLKNFTNELRTERYDYILDAQGLLRSALIARTARGREIVGFSDAREGASFFYSRKVPIPLIPENSLHAVRKNLLLLESMGLPPDIRNVSVSYTKEDRTALASLLSEEGFTDKEPYILLHPGAKRSIKQWPSLYFSDLLTRLKGALPHVSLVLVGSSEDRALLSEIAGRTRAEPLVLPGKIPIDLLPLFFSGALLYIGNDSGPLHLAVMSGTRTISFYGSSSPARTGPFGGSGMHLTLGDPVPCSPCGDFRRFCSHQSCLVGVTPDVVLDRALALIDAENMNVRKNAGEAVSRKSA